MSINALTSPWTPPEVKATDLTDTDSAKQQAEEAQKAPVVDDAGQTAYVSPPIESANPAEDRVGQIGNNWKLFFGKDGFTNFLANRFGTNSGINPNFIRPETANNVWVV
jgi:hypothetical protein